MRKRSVSFYAKNEEEFERIFDRKKSLLERRHSRFSPFTKRNPLNEKEKTYSYFDDLEIDELGVNSCFQITQKEENAEGNGAENTESNTQQSEEPHDHPAAANIAQETAPAAEQQTAAQQQTNSEPKKQKKKSKKEVPDDN